MANLAGRVAVVTGASKGIGAAVAERLAADGASVVVNYGRSADLAQAVVDRVQKKGGKAKAIQADVSKISEIRKLYETTERELGRPSILVNNAGIYLFAPLDQITEEHYSQMFDLNVKGLLFATQAAAKAFGSNGGRIVNISSVVANAPMPSGSVYAATKAAIDSLTRSLAAELGPKKIYLNSVLPGPVQTEGLAATVVEGAEEVVKGFVAQTPLGRIGQPDDIAAVVSFLVSDDARWVTGTTIYASGGLR